MNIDEQKRVERNLEVVRKAIMDARQKYRETSEPFWATVTRHLCMTERTLEVELMRVKA